MNFHSASKSNFQIPTEPETLKPSYFVFIWGDVEEVPGGENQRMRIALRADSALSLPEIISLAKEEANGRIYAVLLGSPEITKAGYPYIKLFLLDGEYPEETDYDAPNMDGTFSSTSI